MNQARLRRDDGHPTQPRLHGRFPLGEFGDLALNLAKFRQHFRQERLPRFGDGKSRLADLNVGLGHFGDQLAALALKLGLFALERQDARLGHELFLFELEHPFELLLDQPQLLLLRRPLSVQASRHLFELADALVLLLFSARPGFEACREQASLAEPDIAGARGGVGRPRFEREPVAALTLGDQPRLARPHLLKLGLRDLKLCPHVRIVEADQNLAHFDQVRVADRDLFDDPALKVLHLLGIALDHNRPGSDHAT